MTYDTVINAAIAGLPPAGGTVDARSIGGAQVLAADIVFSPHTKLLLASDLVLTMNSYRFLVPPGVHGCSLIGDRPWGSTGPVGSTTFLGSQLIWTGGAGDAAVLVGGTAAQTEGFLLEDVGIDISGASTTSRGIRLNQVMYFDLIRPHVYGMVNPGSHSQVGIHLDGDGTFFTGWGMIRHPVVSLCNYGILGDGTGVHAANSLTVVGGSIQGAGLSHGAAGIAVNPGEGWAVLGTDIDGYDIGVYCGPNNTAGHHLLVRTENCTTAIYLDTGCTNSFAHSMSPLPVTSVEASNVLVVQGAVRGGASAPRRIVASETDLATGLVATGVGSLTVVLTGNLLVGLPTGATPGQRIVFTFLQGGSGGYGITWNAAFKKSWSDSGNVSTARSSIAFIFDGAVWNQDGAQAPYVV